MVTIHGNKKAFFAALIVLLIIMRIAAPDVTAYTDVPDSAWYAGVTNRWGYLLANGDIAAPEAPVTRAEFAHVLNGIMNFPANAAAFSDVSAETEYNADIGALQSAGVVMGVGGGRYNPDATVTRAEVAVMLARAFALEPQGTPRFNDAVSIPEYAAPYLNALQESGYFKGDNNGNFGPNNLLKRCEIFQVIENAATNHIEAAETVTSISPGNMIISKSGAVIRDITARGNIIIAPAVGDGNVTLDNALLSGTLIIRGGGADSIKITGRSFIPRIFVNKSGPDNIRISIEDEAVVSAIIITGGEGEVIIDGKVSNVTLSSEYTTLKINGTVAQLNVAAQNAGVSMAETAVVTNLYIARESTGTILYIAGILTAAQMAAPASNLAVSGAAVIMTLGVAGSAVGATVHNNGTIESLLVKARDAEVANSGSIDRYAGPPGSIVTGTPPNNSTVVDAGSVNDVYAV